MAEEVYPLRFIEYLYCEFIRLTFILPHIAFFLLPVNLKPNAPFSSLLKDLTGALVTNDYQAYSLLTKATHCGCWTHARRKWREAMPEGATVKTSKVAIGFQYCNKLFAQERKCAAYKPKYCQEYRQNKELPLLEEYYAWLKTIHPEKGSKLEEAVRYSLNQKQQLTTFLSKCHLSIYPWPEELAVLRYHKRSRDQHHCVFPGGKCKGKRSRTIRLSAACAGGTSTPGKVALP